MPKVISRRRVGLLLPEPGPWQSLSRTGRFYERCLRAEFDLTVARDEQSALSQSSLDAILNFGVRGSWRTQIATELPRIHPVHGGLVLDRESVSRSLRFLKPSDCLVVNCSSDLAILKNMVSDNGPSICQLPLPVDQVAFRRQSMNACRDLTNCGKFDHVIGFVSRLLPQKNLHRFLEIFAELKGALAPQKIGGLIVGTFWVNYPCLPFVTEAYPEYITSQIRALGLESDIVYFQGTLGDEELSWCYNSMTALFHPTLSIDENFGYAPVEAMCCGVPVVGTAYGGLKDTVVDGETGYLMPSWVTKGGLRLDLKTAFDALKRILSSSETRQRLSSNAENRARTQYNEGACSSILASCVYTAIQRSYAKTWTSQSETSGTMAPADFTERSQSYLPTTTPPWEFYIQSVSSYVSGRVSLDVPLCYLRTAGKFLPIDNRTWVLDDPAWPAHYILDKKEIALLDAFREWRLVRPSDLDSEVKGKIKRFLECGLLITSLPKSYE